MSDAARAGDADPVLLEYARLAAHYDATWSWFNEAAARETLRRVTIRPTDRVLDVGCGSGDLLRELRGSRPGARLAGVDPVPEMLDVARRKLPANVELARAWANRLPYADGTFDVVVCCNALHNMRGPMAALSELRRVLKPDGALVVTDWCGDYLACRIRDWYQRLANPAHAKVYRGEECLRLLREAGFPYAKVDRYKVSASWGLMTAVAADSPQSLPLGRRAAPSRSKEPPGVLSIETTWA